jgi:hypothetical protein
VAIHFGRVLFGRPEKLKCELFKWTASQRRRFVASLKKRRNKISRMFVDLNCVQSHCYLPKGGKGETLRKVWTSSRPRGPSRSLHPLLPYGSSTCAKAYPNEKGYGSFSHGGWKFCSWWTSEGLHKHLELGALGVRRSEVLVCQ